MKSDQDTKKLLYADDLVLVCHLRVSNGNLEAWKGGLEIKKAEKEP